jgi:hypothetical protein
MCVEAKAAVDPSSTMAAAITGAASFGLIRFGFMSSVLLRKRNVLRIEPREVRVRFCPLPVAVTAWLAPLGVSSVTSTLGLARAGRDGRLLA